MSTETNSTEPTTEPQKRGLRNPFTKKNDTPTDTSKLDNIKSKTKTVLAVVGAVTVVSVVAGAVAKRKGVDSVEVNLPSVDADSTDV